jgi:endonuclease/exonuclease/phosphatase family metal-dependent hydrolase
MISIMSFARLLIAFVALTAVLPRDAAALRIMTYNILNYSSGREAEFRAIVAAIQPDVVVVQEILSQAAVNRFRDQVLNQVDPGEWAAGNWTDGPDTDAGFFYRTASVAYVSHFSIVTSLRDIDEWTFRPSAHSSAAANVRIYTVHLKASQGITNEQQRLAEVTTMRARMESFPVGQNYLCAGDFNIYTATEPAYVYMTDPSNGLAGVLQDPIDREGNWHENSAFADVHTQSPRITQFGGGANGGMDDRFDLILVGPAVQDGEGLDVLEETYTAFGQDGEHFNGALNVAPFTVVDSTMASNLHNASDHLPVHVDFQVYALLATASSLDLGAAIVGGTAGASLPVANGAEPPADELDYSFAAPPGFTAPGGPFTADAGSPGSLHPIDHPAVAPGIHTGSLGIATDDPDRPAHTVALTATVLAHAVPSLDGTAIVPEVALDLGPVASGDTVAAVAAVHDLPVDSFQAALEVWDVGWAGDPRFFLPGGFAAFLVAPGAPEPVTVAFDAAGAAAGTYEATLTLHTRDEPLSGATDLADLSIDLSATVGGATGAGAMVTATDVAGIQSAHPNPFGSSTTIRFGVGRPGRVELRIYDVRGREVRTLVAGELAAGAQVRTWDGRDAAGHALAPGIYFARFASGATVETEKLVRLR